jgi:serine protease Do
MKLRFYVLPLLVGFLLTGCLIQNVKKNHVIQVSDSNPEKINANEQTVVFQIGEIKNSIPVGKIVEVQSAGSSCDKIVGVFHKVEDKDSEASQSSETMYKDWIKNEFNKYNIKTTNINVPFILNINILSEISNTCYLNPAPDTSQSQAEIYVNVSWTLKAKDGEDLFNRTTEGSFKTTQFGANPLRSIEGAYKMATRKLISDDEFISILTFNDQKQKQAPSSNTTIINTSISDKSYEALYVTQIKSKLLGPEKSKWSEGVFTLITDQGHGSGFAISENLILTNNHVIAGEEDVLIKMAQEDGSFKAWNGKVIRKNEKRDVALIKVQGKLKNYFSTSKKVKQGDDIYVMGSPLDINHEATLTDGIISHSKRNYDGLFFIQSNANIYGGNSGGPMINIEGNVIGISVMANREAEGLNLFIPIQDALKYLNIKINN